MLILCLVVDFHDISFVYTALWLRYYALYDYDGMIDGSRSLRIVHPRFGIGVWD